MGRGLSTLQKRILFAALAGREARRSHVLDSVRLFGPDVTSFDVLGWKSREKVNVPPPRPEALAMFPHLAKQHKRELEYTRNHGWWRRHVAGQSKQSSFSRAKRRLIARGLASWCYSPPGLRLTEEGVRVARALRAAR